MLIDESTRAAAARSNEARAGVPNDGSSSGTSCSSQWTSTRATGLRALVSVNGRTDIAVDSLRGLRVPTLLIVNDMPVLRVNREAVSLIKAERRIEIVHGSGEQATHAIVEKCVRWLADRLVPAPVAVY